MVNIKSYHAIVVPKNLVKLVKDALDAAQRLDKRAKITPLSQHKHFTLIEGNTCDSDEGLFAIPVLTGSGDARYNTGSLPHLLRLTSTQSHESKISLGLIYDEDVLPGKAPRPKGNALANAIEAWLRKESIPNLEQTLDGIHERAWSYAIYSPMLLLPFPFYTNIMTFLPSDGLAGKFQSLYEMICQHLKVTHIALNAPIPERMLLKEDSGSDMPMSVHEDSLHQAQAFAPNILRSPTGLTPLHGDFGPELGPHHAPTQGDFASAFWCAAQQNGIIQCWAPRYTMFSRGNISEKARILRLSSLTQPSFGTSTDEISAVDLYAGIGYFAFSYVKAGVGKVLCWEINPWSVEGLRRGAGANGWEVQVVKERDHHADTASESNRLIVFEETNQRAAERIATMSSKLPPIKHINCGFLPSSADSWKIAVKLLDFQGGWIHVHENIAKQDIEARKQEIVKAFGVLTNEKLVDGSPQPWKVDCDHVEEVKSYAPGIMHYVLDIAVWPDSCAQ